MVNPPKEGDESYPLYREEYDGIFKGLQERAMALYEAFKKMEGVECDVPQVRIYLTIPIISHTPVYFVTNNTQGFYVSLPDYHHST